MGNLHNKYWTDDKIEWLRANSKGIRRDILCEMYNEAFDDNVSLERFVSACNRYHILNGLNTAFQKGGSSWNKGKKRVDYMSAEAIAKCEKTQFKKGCGRHKGDIYIAKKRNNDRWYIKLGDGKRQKMLYDKWLWETTHDVKLEPGDMVIHLDGDYLNCDLDNLMCVKVREHMSIIGKMGKEFYHGKNAELKKAFVLSKKLEVRMRELKE